MKSSITGSRAFPTLQRLDRGKIFKSSCYQDLVSSLIPFIDKHD